MSWISLLLTVKVLFTFIIVVIPLLFLSKNKLEKLMRVKTETPLLFRLYGIALLALLSGYSFGIPSAESGIFPWGVVCMGIVSNGGAVLVLLSAGLTDKNRVAVLLLTVVAAAFSISALFPQVAIQKIW